MNNAEVKEAIENFLNNPAGDTKRFLEAIDQMHLSVATKLEAENRAGSDETAPEYERFVQMLNLNLGDIKYQAAINKIDELIKDCSSKTFDDSPEVVNLNVIRYQVLAYLHLFLNKNAPAATPSHRCTLI